MIMEKNRLPSSHRECVRREGWLWLGVTSYSNFIISNYKSHFISRCAIYSRYEPCQWWHLIAQTYTHTHAERSHLMEENFSPHHKTSFYVQSFFFMPSVHRGMSIICNNFATTVLFFSSTSNSPKMSTRFSFSLFLFIFSCAVLFFLLYVNEKNDVRLQNALPCEIKAGWGSWNWLRRKVSSLLLNLSEKVEI